jgi:single-stranded-DNA-specific exonuclease
MKKTIKRRDVATDNNSFSDLHPLLKRIYSGRGVLSGEELQRDLQFLLPFHTLRDIDKAVECLAQAIYQQQKILIIGDFDADGATSTALMIRALKSFGAQAVNYLVPNRFEFGYGLTSQLVEVAKQTFSPDLIVTVDNGIANHAGVITAKNHGIKVVITDHHLAGETLPLADAIVNPNQPGDNFPSKSIAGVGVAFYVMLALRRYLSEAGWFIKSELTEPNMSQLLDLVALGTVADVVSLDHNNRIMVHQGIRRIRAGRCISGITALLTIAQRQPSTVSSADLGFAVGPRLNAAGRLDDMSLGIECLLADDLNMALEIAKSLNQLNDERRVIEQEMQTQAFMNLNTLSLDKLPIGVCLFDETWHQGVVGILASRIKDRLHRPVLIFALANDGSLKGSGRSIHGLHIRDVLTEIDVRYPNLISKFGGHAMAAGLTIAADAFTTFAKVFNEVVSAKITEEALHQLLMSDGELLSNELSLEIAEILREAGPWGQSFPEPVFDGVFAVVDQHLVAGKHLKMNLMKEDKIISAIAFNVNLNEWPNYRCQQVNIAYRLDINEFKGSKKIQLVVEQLEAF